MWSEPTSSYSWWTSCPEKLLWKKKLVVFRKTWVYKIKEIDYWQDTCFLLESRKMKELQKTDDGLATPRFVKGKYFYIEECNTAVKTLWIGEITCFTFRIIWNMTIYFVYLSQPKATQINWKSFAWRYSGVNEIIRKLNQGKIAGWISKLTTTSAQC